MKQKCGHFDIINPNDISPRTKGCEECEKEETNRVAIRMCLICGHIGCCDSPRGMYARKH